MLHINDKKLVWFTKYLPIVIIISSVSLREDSVHRYEEAALAKSQSLF